MGHFSNGTEGLLFEEQFCQHCIHSDFREGKNIGDADNPPCPVWFAHECYCYEECNSKSNAKAILDMLITPGTDGDNECRMFAAKPGFVRGQMALPLDVDA